MHPARVKRATSRYRIDQGFGQAFTINKQSPQAKGLVFWLPFTDIRGQAKHIDLVSGLVLTENNTPVWVNDSERGWVMEFEDASDQYLLNDNAVPVDVTPLTIACWFYSTETDRQGLITLGAASNAFDIELNAQAVRAIAFGGTLGIATSTANYSISTWEHACGVFESSILRTVYFNASNSDTNITDVTPSVSQTSVGSLRPTSSASDLDGCVTDCRIYNRALSDLEVYELYKNPWDLFKVREPQVWVTSPVSIISGEVVWGHDTAVLEANVRDFTGNWTGTGAIAGAGDAEALELETTEYMIGEVVNTGVRTVQLLQNEYDPSGDDVDMDYRHGATEAACLAAGWNNYVGTFSSLGYVQVRTTSTL